MPLFSRLSEKIATFWRESTGDIESVGLLDEVSEEQRSRPSQLELKGDGRYCKLLAVGNSNDHQGSHVAAWKALEERMTLTPGGEVGLLISSPVATQTGFEFAADTIEAVSVGPFYVDRYAVTNAEYAQFVAQGGYGIPELWAPEMLAQVLQFVDETGSPGPRDWRNGTPPEQKLGHPVVGVSWYEALAYAKWVGKKLPTPAQWQQCGCWPTNESGHGAVLRYPWGNAFDPQKANTWSSNLSDTAPANDYAVGCTPNGIYQLVGNVWEWVDSEFEIRPGGEGIQVITDQPMAEIRGGAFDTYFDSQSTCQYRTGQIKLHRPANVGFRCCIDADDLCLPPDPSAFLEEDEQ